MQAQRDVLHAQPQVLVQRQPQQLPALNRIRQVIRVAIRVIPHHHHQRHFYRHALISESQKMTVRHHH